MENIPDGIIQERKSAEVCYVPDSKIATFVRNANEKIEATPRGRKNRNYQNEDDWQIQTSPSTKITRSGRKITNRFQKLSISGDTVKKDLNTSSDTPEFSDSEIDKPDEKLFENGDVRGKDMFSFRTPRRQSGMVNKANEVASKNNETPTNKTPRLQKRIWTPNSTETGNLDPTKTPHSLRNKLRKRLIDEAAKQELDRLLEDSGSDFVPSSSESESESSESSDSDDNFLPQEDITEKYPSQAKKSKQQIKDYVFTSEDYFDRRYSKIMTSGHTLKKLKTPRLGHSQLTALLKGIPTSHKHSLDCLIGGVAGSFKHWLFCFSEGYNILLYGLGSKKRILELFRMKYLSNCSTICINGYFPDTSVKSVLDVIVSEMLHASNIPSQPHEILEMIEEKLKSKNTPRIFIFISNLEGKPFQNDKAQWILSQLAKIKKVHMVATVDHINSALLWDQSKLSAFNFIWEDGTTYEQYLEETSYEGSLMVNWSGGMALASLKNVFHSLTVNSRKVFKILLNHQLENKYAKYSGMHFSELYRACREDFVVSSDLALRTILTEFTDHELVKWKKESDHLIITVDQNTLKQFKEEVDLDK